MLNKLFRAVVSAAFIAAAPAIQLQAQDSPEATVELKVFNKATGEPVKSIRPLSVRAKKVTA